MKASSFDDLKRILSARRLAVHEEQKLLSTIESEANCNEFIPAACQFDKGEIDKFLFSPPPPGKSRSEQAWAFYSAARKRGLSLVQLIDLANEHFGRSPVLEHYNGKANQMAADIRRIYSKLAEDEDRSRIDWIYEINRFHALVRHGSDALVARFEKDYETGNSKISFMTSAAFEKLFCNKYIQAAGDERPRPAGKVWMSSPLRREYTGGITFQPGQTTPQDVLNLYQGWAVEPKPGNWSLLRNHIRDVICGGDADYFDYVIGWLASSVRNLDKPLGVALVFRGGQGTGKGIVWRALGRLFGRHFVQIARSDLAIGRFNAAIGNALFVFADEAFYAGNAKEVGTLKSLITEPYISIEEKFRDSVMRRNTIRLGMATNEAWAVPTEIDDRRFAVFDTTKASVESYGYFQEMQDQLESGGYEAMLHELLSLDLTMFEIRKIPDTRARAEQKTQSIKGPMAWLFDCLYCGQIGIHDWTPSGLTILTEVAYRHYAEGYRERGEYRVSDRALWGRRIHKALGDSLGHTRPRLENNLRPTQLVFGPLEDCRVAFGRCLNTTEIVWEENTP